MEKRETGGPRTATAPARSLEPQPPTHQRYWVAAFGLVLSFLSFLDRGAMGQVAPSVSRELGLSPVQMGYVFAAFGLAYSAFEIPGGWLGDRIGPRKVLSGIVVCWSFFTAATGWVTSFSSLVIVRFLFGVGEAGCFPTLASCFRTWLPFDERPKVEGLKAASARWGAAATPVLFFYLQDWLGWRGVLQVFAVAGLVWVGAFYFVYRDAPHDHKGVNAAELALLEAGGRRSASHHGTPWRAFLRSRSTWLVWTQWFCYFYGFYFYLTWLPTYLQQSRHLNLSRSAMLAALPLISAGMGSISAGWSCAWLIRRTGRVALVRRTFAFAAFGTASILLLLFINLRNPVLAMTALAVSSFAAEFVVPISWTTCMDLGGRHVGSFAGGMGTVGQLGGAVAPAVIGYILQWTGHNWAAVFYVSAAVYAVGILCWVLIDPVTPLDRD